MTTNSKKIVLIAPMPPYRGGIAHFSASLAEQLLDMGHDVNVISFRKQYPKLLYPGRSEKDHSQTISEGKYKHLHPKVICGTDTGYWLKIFAECQIKSLAFLSSS